MTKPRPISLELWRNWHRVDPHATPDQIYFAFRTPREAKRRRLLIHQFRGHFSSITEASGATNAAGVAAAPVQAPEGLGIQVCKWIKTPEGHLPLAALTLASDTLVRFLSDPKNLGHIPPSSVSFDDILVDYAAALRDSMEEKGKQLALSADMHNPQHRMMAAACTEALHWGQQAQPSMIPHIMSLRWLKGPAAAFIELANMRETPTATQLAGEEGRTRLVQPTVKLPK